MHKFIAMGRVVRDPETRQGDKGMVARYTLAVDRQFKREGEPDADFFNCVCFGKTAEFAEKYLHKGIKIAIEGSVRLGKYTNKEGATVHTTDVVIDRHEFCESKNAATEKPNEPDNSASGYIDVPDSLDDELPFS